MIIPFGSRVRVHLAPLVSRGRVVVEAIDFEGKVVHLQDAVGGPEEKLDQVAAEFSAAGIVVVKSDQGLPFAVDPRLGDTVEVLP